MIPRTLTITCVLALIVESLLPACGGAQTVADARPGSVEDQIAQGQAAYGRFCADCHGPAGEGQDAPALVGSAALPLDPPARSKFRKAQFHTAMDVAGFVVESMPPKDKPQPKSADIYWAILAFDLHANGVKLDSPLGPHNAASIVLH